MVARKGVVGVAGSRRVWVHTAGASRTALVVGVAVVACATGAGLVLAHRSRLERGRAVATGVDAARAVASAVETYQVEYGAFPRARNRAQLESALAGLLPRPDPLVRTRGHFRYRATASTYTLTFTPAGGAGVVLRVRRGKGGTAVVGGQTMSIAW